VALKKHGQTTAYAVVLDADHTLDNVWRMRLTCARLARECARRCALQEGFCHGWANFVYWKSSWAEASAALRSSSHHHAGNKQ
jgi:hypothetical protein